MTKHLIAGDAIDGSTFLQEDTTAESAGKSFAIAALLIEPYCPVIRSSSLPMPPIPTKNTVHSSLNAFAIHVSIQSCARSAETPREELAASCQNALFALDGWAKCIQKSKKSMCRRVYQKMQPRSMPAEYVMSVKCSLALFNCRNDANDSAFSVYKLTVSSTLIGQECVICFEEFGSGKDGII